MDFSITFGRPHEPIVLVTAGTASVEGFRLMNQALVEDPDFRPGMPILFDHTSLDVKALTAADARAIAAPPVALGTRVASSRIAIVSPDPLGFGFGRMSLGHANVMRRGADELTVGIFYTLGEATAWMQR
jgi:hypothetical protein